MKFCQTRDYPDFGLSYEIKYSLEESDSQIKGEISIEADDEWNDIGLSSIEATESLQLSWDCENNDIRTLIISFEINYPDQNSGGKLLVTVSDNSNEQILHLKIPPIRLLVLYRRLLQSEVPVKAHDQLESILEEDDSPFSLPDVISCSPFAITRVEFITVLDRLGEYDPSLQKLLREIFLNELTDWIHNQNSGKYYSVNIPVELESLVSDFNNKPNTPDVDSPILSTIIERREEYIGRGLKGFLEGNLGKPDFPYHELSLKSRAFIFAQITNRNSPDKLVNKLGIHADKEEFDIGDKLDGYDYNSLTDLVREIPVAASSNDETATRYAICHYLRLFMIVNETEDINQQTKAYLYRAIIRLSEDQPFNWLAEDARHKRHLALAEDSRESDPERATKHFDQAILVLSQATDWDYNDNEYFYTILRKTNHDIDLLAEDRLFDEAIERLTERIELLQQFGDDENTGFQNKVLHELQGLQHETQAEKLVTEDQFERARELYNKAAGEYRRAESKHLFRGVKGRQYQIDALLAELNGDFEDAAEAHQNYVDELPESDGSLFHKVRRQLSLAKDRAVDGDYDGALEHLDKVNTELHVSLHPVERQFKHLLRAAKAFDNRDTADLDDHIQALILGLEEDEERYLLNFSDDFSTGLLTVLAAHRLRDLPVNESRLQELIDLSIEAACYPKAPEERSQNIAQISVSPTVGMSHDWELSLPNHVINQLDQVRIEQQTTFGESDSLVWRLGVAVEQTLSILREYYARQYWGDDWESKVPGKGKPTIGDLYQFFHTEGASDLNSAEQIIKLFESEIIEDNLLKELRNALSHGRNPNPNPDREERIDEPEFDIIFEHIIDMMRIVTTDIPVIGFVDSQFAEDTYKITLQWGGLPKQIWISTKYNLNTGELYYFPREEFDSTTTKAVSISEKVIEPCEGPRAVSHLPS